MHLWELEQMTSPASAAIRFEHFGELMHAVTPSYDALESMIDTLARNVTPTPDPVMIGWSWTLDNGGSKWPDVAPDLFTVWGVVHGETKVTAWCCPVGRAPSIEQEVRSLLMEFGCRTDRIMLPEPVAGEFLEMVDQINRMVWRNANNAADAQANPPAHWDRAQLFRWPARAIANAISTTLDQFINMIRDREWSAEMVINSWQSNHHDQG